MLLPDGLSQLLWMRTSNTFSAGSHITPETGICPKPHTPGKATDTLAANAATATLKSRSMSDGA